MVNAAVLGFGVVGSGVVELLETNREKISAGAAQEIRVKYILDIRQFSDSPYARLFTANFETIENDPEVQVVVETIGGVGYALDFTRRAIAAGKSVVTSNKELVAAHGQELLEMAREKNVNYLFEGSVGGGIPIIRPLTQCLAANEISEVYGILNGTTNYILTQMFKNKQDFNSALYSARENGYAEADPSSDIQGTDTCRKICILADLSFGRHIAPEGVNVEGIAGVTAEDMAFAASRGAGIKLIGRAKRMGDGSAAVYVAPHYVEAGHMLSNVDGVFNCIAVRGNALGESMFYGRGAGKLPTASAVVADIIDAAKHFHARKYIYWEKGGVAADSGKVLYSRWYVRVKGGAVLAEKFGDAVDVLGTDGACAGFLTKDEMNRPELDSMLAGCEVLSAYRVL